MEMWDVVLKKNERKVKMTETIQQMAELLLKNSIDGMQDAVTKKLEETETAFNARLDGLKVALNEKIGLLEAISSEAPLSIKMGSVEAPKTKIVHSAFLKVLKILQSQKRIQKNIMFVGEAGSGKTHLANSLAEALNLKFYPMSVGLQTTKSDLLGFINAHGQYVTSPVREAFEKGGILLLDEFDSAHAGVVTIINSLLANGHCSFPDKIVEKHESFICIVACNTYGHGANIDYVGRNRLDGATLDRFIVVDVGYDKKLEKALTNNNEWLDIVEKIRKNVEKQGIKMIISPRASMNGADLLEAGFKMQDVVDMCILKGADKDTRKKCLQDIVFPTKSSSSKVELSQTVEKSEYKRDKETYLTFRIRTENESLDYIESYIALSDYSSADFSVGGFDEDFTIHFGKGWTPEFDAEHSIYFSNKINEITGYSPNKFTDFERDYVKRSLIWFEEQINKGVKSPQKPIAFEFVAKGSRTPFKTLVMEAE